MERLNMKKIIDEKYIMESRELEVKRNNEAQIQYKSDRKTYTEDEVKELITDVLKGVTYENDK